MGMISVFDNQPDLSNIRLRSLLLQTSNAQRHWPSIRTLQEEETGILGTHPRAVDPRPKSGQGQYCCQCSVPVKLGDALAELLSYVLFCRLRFARSHPPPMVQ